MVAMVAGSWRVPQINTTGIRYTKAGMTCMASMMGRTVFHTPLLRALRIPSGMPTAQLTITATRIMPMVWVISSQNPSPSRAAAVSPTPPSRPTRKPRIIHPITRNTSTKRNQGTLKKTLLMMRSSRNSKGAAMASVSHWRLTVTQFTASFPQAPMGSSHWSRKSPFVSQKELSPWAWATIVVNRLIPPSPVSALPPKPGSSPTRPEHRDH